MGEQLRLQILALDKHHNSGTSSLKDDVKIADELGRPASEIQAPLDILDGGQLAKLYRGTSPSYAADSTPGGLLFL